MQYGKFILDGTEYEIHDPRTPSPWINYLYGGRYFSLISNNGGGMSYVDNPLHGRITRYRINDVPPDRPGKYIYIRDRETGSMRSLFWQPAGGDHEQYTTWHGFGYTRVRSMHDRIESEGVFFVPDHGDQEIWSCTFLNTSDRVRKLSLYAYVEFCLGHAHVDLINQCDDQHFNRVRFDEKLNALFATKTYWVTQHQGTQQQENQAWNQIAFFTVGEPVVEYETLRERFIGPYRNESDPLAIEEGKLSCRDTDYGNAVGVLRVDMELAPSETKRVNYRLGVIPKDRFEAECVERIDLFAEPAAVERALAAVKERWKNYFSVARATTPDPDTNLFANYWIPYQARVAFDVGRVASFYYWGIGRGFGFRDTSQDTIAISATDPGKARERIIRLSRQMFSTGKVYHHFVADRQGETTGHCDDPFWFILAMTDYLRETGDLALLDHVEPYIDHGSASILDRLMAVARLSASEAGPHGLPRFGRGDWNDTLDYIGGDEGGESVWGGLFYAAMLKDLSNLLEFVSNGVLARETRGLREKLLKAINEHCWDGAWYIRAFGQGDRKIGSSENKAGRIFLNAQTWAVIAQAAERDRLVKCMDSVAAELDTIYGPKICAPAFREIDPSIGLITRCVAGKKENGAIFCHPLTWTIMAECLLGRGDRAFSYFKKTLPNAVDPDTFCAEPYVYSQYITSDEHDAPGKASHSWQTGTAAWMKKVIFDYLFGFRADYRGIVIDPVIPPAWTSFRVERTFRNTRYIFDVENPKGRESGVTRIEADGETITDRTLPFSDKRQVTIKIVM